MNLLKFLSGLVTTLLVAACGGGGGSSGGSVFGGPSAGVAEVVVVLSKNTIASVGEETVTATVTTLDANRNALPRVAVKLSVDANAIITPAGTATDDNGRLTAVVGVGADRTARTITVTASAGSSTSTARLQVTEATGGSAVASDLTLLLNAQSLANSGTATVRATATAVDSKRNAVPGIPIAISVDSSAVATVSGPVTDAQGVVTAEVGIGADRTNRVVTVTATSGSLVRRASFRVIGAKLTASFAPVINTGSANNRIEYQLIDTNALPMTGQPITISAPGLPTANAETDINGKYVYSFAAPGSATTLAVTAVAAGDSVVSNISVQPAGGGAVPPAAEQPKSASLATNPSVVAVNTVGSTTNQAELRALFVGNDNKPIPNIRVRFDLDGNTSNTDGVPSALGGAVAYSDSTGVARGTFVAGQRSSPTNGVVIRACFSINDFAAGTCPNATRATLTVAAEALSVNIRTNELIEEGDAKLTYIKKYVAMVVDAAGQAKPDVLVTPSVDLTAFYKGFWRSRPLVKPAWFRVPTLAPTEAYRWTGTAWEKTTGTGVGSCPNEDANRNAVREAAPFNPSLAAPAVADRAEDLNWNNELDPRKADVAIKMVGSARTDASGLAILQIEYGKDLGSWVDFVITVTATGVAGSESRARYAGNLPVAAADIADEGKAPAFVVSPYGIGALDGNGNPIGVCTDTR